MRTLTITPKLQQQNPAFYFGIGELGNIVNYYERNYYDATAIHAVVLGLTIESYLDQIALLTDLTDRFGG